MFPNLGQNKCEKVLKAPLYLDDLVTHMGSWEILPVSHMGPGDSQIVWDFPLLLHTIEKQ